MSSRIHEKRQTKYKWQKDHTWLWKCKNDQFSAYCKICKKTFSVSGGGIFLMKQHKKTKTNVSSTEELCNQLTFQKDSCSVVELDKSIQFSDKVKITRAKIFTGFEVCRCKLVFFSLLMTKENDCLWCFQIHRLLKTTNSVKLKWNIRCTVF